MNFTHPLNMTKPSKHTLCNFCHYIFFCSATFSYYLIPQSIVLVCRDLGNSSDVIPGQLKERAGFLVSRSLKLPAAPPWAECVIWWFNTCPPEKKNSILLVYLYLTCLKGTHLAVAARATGWHRHARLCTRTTRHCWHSSHSRPTRRRRRLPHTPYR